MDVNVNSGVTLNDIKIEKSKLVLKDLVEIYGLDEKMEEFKIDLNLYKKSIDMVREILGKNPCFFENIIKIMDNCMEDGVLDLSDIPQLVLDLTKIYKSEKFQLTDVKVVDFLNFVEFLLVTLEKMKYINISKENEEKFVKTLKASLNLLEIVVPEGETLKSFCSCLFG